MNTWEQRSWLGAATLETVAELNAQIVALLRAQCSANGVQSRLIQDVSHLLPNLDAASAKRLADCGVLLADAGFACASRWTDAIVGGVNDGRLEPQPFFTVDGAVGVMRQVMTHAWHLARSEPAAARLLLGLSPASAALIGGCTLHRVTLLAETRAGWLRPRWEQRPSVWPDLLRMAAQGDAAALERLRVRSLQLLAADARASGP
ncbi:MAG TPA: hypothetical protein VMF03_02615 [Steroidobacteraceae bacterium]|nr:hypothetical protein [Steroidobacteraceae bacterium]